MRTDKEYTGLGLTVPKRRHLMNSNDIVNDSNHQNSIDCPSSVSSAQNDNGGTSLEILIPSWRVLPVNASLSGDLTDCEVWKREREREEGRERESWRVRREIKRRGWGMLITRDLVGTGDG